MTRSALDLFRLLRMALALVALGPCRVGAADLPRPTFYLDPQVGYYDWDGVVSLLVANGAAAEVRHVPFGRGSHYLDGPGPACGTMVTRDLPNRTNFHWLAPSLDYEIVIAAPAGVSAPPPGALVSAYHVKLLRRMLEKQGFRPVEYYEGDQVAALFQSGRVEYVALGEPDLEPVSSLVHRGLSKVTVLGHVRLWLACNANVTAGDAAAIGKAWRRAMTSGQIPKLYRDNGIARFLPEQEPDGP